MRRIAKDENGKVCGKSEVSRTNYCEDHSKFEVPRETMRKDTLSDDLNKILNQPLINKRHE